jgi:hypothetical protein
MGKQPRYWNVTPENLKTNVELLGELTGDSLRTDSKSYREMAKL